MMDEHVHEWDAIVLDNPHEFNIFCSFQGCDEVPSVDNIIVRLSVAERLSAEIEKFILFHHKTLHPRHKEGLRAIAAYLLEEKS